MASKRYTARKSQSRHYPWLIFDTKLNKVRLSGYLTRENAQEIADEFNAVDTTPPTPRCEAAVWKSYRDVQCQHPSKHTVEVMPAPLFGSKGETFEPRTVHVCGVHLAQLKKCGRSGINIVTARTRYPGVYSRSIPNERAYLIEPTSVSHRGLKMEDDDAE
jgi:hypothetical protein